MYLQWNILQKTLAEEEFNRRLKHLEALGEYVAGSDEDHVLSFSRDGGIRQGNRMKVRLRSGQVTNFGIVLILTN